MCTADGDIIQIREEPPAALLPPNLGYRLALLCGFGLGFVIALVNFIGGHERRGFQAIVIQWSVVIWILAMLMFLVDLIGLNGKLALILLLGTMLLLPLAVLALLRRVPWPAPPPASSSSQAGVPKRGGCLTAFLMFALTSNPFIALLYLLIAPVIQGYSRDIAWVVPGSILGAIVSFFLALAVWNWKKVGVFGYAASYVVGIVVCLAAGLPIYAALLQLLGLVILISLVRPVWNNFE